MPTLTAQFNVFVDGGQRLMGLADVVLPNFSAMVETVTGAGIMGEIEVPAVGQMSAMTFTMNFRSMLDDPLTYAISQAYHFDLRSAQDYEDPTNYERGIAKERFSIIGPVKVLNPGNRAPNTAWAASIEVAARRIEHYMDGALKIEYDPLNGVYSVDGVDIYAAVRAAVGQ
jgi:hypothetical protein